MRERRRSGRRPRAIAAQRMGGALLAIAGAAFCRHRPARFRAGHVSGQSPDRRPLSGGDRVGLDRGGRSACAARRRSWRRRFDADRNLAQGGQNGADGRTLRLQRRACRAGARDLPCTRRRALDLCRAGRGGLDRGDAWNGERAQAVRGACAHSAHLLRSPGSCCSRLTASPASRAPRCRLLGLVAPFEPAASVSVGLGAYLVGHAAYRSRRCF